MRFQIASAMSDLRRTRHLQGLEADDVLFEPSATSAEIVRLWKHARLAPTPYRRSINTKAPLDFCDSKATGSGRVCHGLSSMYWVSTLSTYRGVSWLSGNGAKIGRARAL